MNYFGRAIRDAEAQSDLGKKYNSLTSIVRSVLQHAAFSCFELADALVGEEDCPDLQSFANRLLQPSDGTIVEIVDGLLPVIDSQSVEGLAQPWFDGREGPSTSSLAKKWVEERNSRGGHGVVDDDTYQAGVSAMRTLLGKLETSLRPLLPAAVSGTQLVLSLPDDEEFGLTTLATDNNHPIVVRRIARKASAWQIQYQPLTFDRSPTTWRELGDDARLVTTLNESQNEYTQRVIGVGEGSWRPCTLVPVRQTETFSARATELAALDEWMNDKDSRACLVYGEGGIGKTTLVLEHINLMLEDRRPDCTWRPELICYYSAKQTRWTDNGLVRFRGTAPAIEDALRMLARSLVTTDRAWYGPTVDELIARLVQVLSAAGLKKNEVLLILDNTETLTRSADEEAVFGATLTKISRQVCRLLMTSRRREVVAAEPIHVLGLSELDGAKLLRKLGEELNATPILEASEQRLREITERLHGRPLLLEVLAKLACRGGRSLKHAQDAVIAQANRDLGTFLFDDAWGRLGVDQRNVLLTLAKLGGSLDSLALGWICQDFKIPYTLWMEGFEETRFGTVASYGPREDIELDVEAVAFLSKKLSEQTPAETEAINKSAAQVERRKAALSIAAEARVTDRVQAAFRTEAAKAAKKAAERGNYREAAEWYEEALREDRGNAFLWDRFAYFLMTKGHDLARAQELAAEAMRLAPGDSDVHFTAGMIAARLTKLDEATRLLERARELGKPAHLVATQAARSFVYFARKTPDAVKAISSLARAEELLVKAKELTPAPESRLGAKHLDECMKVQSEIEALKRKRRLTRA